MGDFARVVEDTTVQSKGPEVKKLARIMSGNVRSSQLVGASLSDRQYCKGFVDGMRFVLGEMILEGNSFDAKFGHGVISEAGRQLLPSTLPISGPLEG